MGLADDTLAVLTSQSDTWLPQLQRHVELSLLALLLAAMIGLPLGAWLTRQERFAFAVVSIANLGRTIPSLALLALVYPLVGTGFAPSVIALVALGVPPILLSTFTGVREVDAGVRDAAAGMGLTSLQRFAQVELPMAAPVILAGVRTSAVQVVASATLAALIGGGGLGELIMAGLTNMRYDLLVAGALLVAALAAATELGFALLERRGLPLGIRLMQAASAVRGPRYQAGAGLTHRHWQLAAVAAVVASGVLVGAGSVGGSMIAGLDRSSAAASGPLPRVVIGSKDFTESIVLAELYAQALEAQGHPVERRFSLGATAVADAALRRGEIDVYPEYTGTALVAVLGRAVPTAGGGGTGRAAGAALARQVDEQVRDGYRGRGMRMLASTPFSNGNAIAVTADTARRLDLETLSDLKDAASRMRFGAIPGFDTRADGLPRLRSVYGIRFGDVRTFENGLKYRALLDGQVDAVYGFETDGQIARHDLVVLRDDRAAWPPYHAAPVVSGAFAKSSGPAFAATLNSVTRLLDADTMRALNAAVDEGGREPHDVAREFLSRHHLERRGPRPTVHVGSKDFTEQYVLGELYAQALEARGFPVQRHLGLGATAVADAALRRGRIDLYPEYTGTAWTAVLRRPVEQGTSAAALWSGVRRGYEQRRLRVLEPTPFSNGNAIAVTRETADRHRLETLSDLAKVSSELRFGAIPGWDTREDGMPLLRRVYGMRFASVRSYENGLKYQALRDGKVDAVYGFETDGAIAQGELVVLRDDRAAWPAYQAAPVVSERFARSVGPDFTATVDHVSSLLDADTMRRLNREVDQDGREPADVARAFLSRHGMTGP